MLGTLEDKAPNLPLSSRGVLSAAVAAGELWSHGHTDTQHTIVHRPQWSFPDPWEDLGSRVIDPRKPLYILI